MPAFDRGRACGALNYPSRRSACGGVDGFHRAASLGQASSLCSMSDPVRPVSDSASLTAAMTPTSRVKLCGSLRRGARVAKGGRL